MNKLLKGAAVALGTSAMMVAGTSLATTLSRTATVTFISPVVISEDSAMNFGSVQTGGTVGQTLILSSAGGALTGTASALYVAGSQQGIYDVDANASQTLEIWVDNYVTATVVPSAATCNYDGGGAGTCDGSGNKLTSQAAGTGGGSKKLHVGMTLTLAGTETAQAYTPGFDITVNYE